MKKSSFLLLLGFALLTHVQPVHAQSVGQWNVNNSLNWYNSTAWLNFAPTSGIGTSVLLNQDIGSGARYAADVVQTFTAAATGLQQQIQLSAIPVNNSLAVTDTTGAFTWSQARLSNTTAWTVNYDATLNQVQITYNPAVSTTRAITIGYATGNASSTLGSFRDLGGIVELIGTTNGSSTVFKKVLSQAVSGTKLSTHDGTVFINGTAGTSGTISVAYNATTREVTITYSSAPPAGRKIVSGYIPLGVTVGLGNTGVTASNTPNSLLVFSRELPLIPNLDTTFITTDGTYTSTNGTSTNNTDFTATYTAPTATALPKVVTTYKTTAALNGVSGVRPIKIDFTSPVGTSMTDVAGLTERVAVGTGALTTFTRTLNQFVNGNELGVTDGTYFWKSGVGSNNPQFTVTYDAVSRLLTVNYGSLTPPSTSVNIIAAYIPKGQTGTATVSVNTTASGTPIVFTRSLTAAPAQDVTFKVLDGFYTWTNGTVTGGATTADFDVAYNSGSKTITTTYKSTASITNIGGGRTLSATYNAASIASKNVTVGTMLMGDVNSTDRMDLRLNSLTFDNGGLNATSQLNKISGVADEIASSTVLNSPLTLAVRTGGDVASKNAFLYSGSISGAGGLTKLDSGNFIISGNNTYTGDTIIRNTGGTTFLNNTASNGSTSSSVSALSSQDIYLGTASRDGHSSMVLQSTVNANLTSAASQATNQIANTSRLWFDGGSGRNPYYRMFGTTEEVAGIGDSSGQGVIENTESENGVAANSKLIVNTLSASDNFLYNGFMRNKSSGDSTGILTLDKSGPGRLILQGGNINFGDAIDSNAGIYPTDTALQNRVNAGTLALINTTNFGSDIVNSATVELATAGDWTFTRSISGTGTVSKTGPNVTALTRDQSYTGATTIEGGTLRLTNQVLTEGMGTGNGSTRVFTRTLNRAAETGSIRVTDGRVDENNLLLATYVGIPSNDMTVTYNAGTRVITATYAVGKAPASGAPVNAVYVVQGPGSLSGTSRIDILTGTLQIINDQNSNLIDNVSGGTEGRIKDTAIIHSNGGTINFDSRRIDNKTFAETIGGLDLTAGRTNITMTSPGVAGFTDTGTNTVSSLIFGNLTRTAGATVIFAGSGLGDSPTDRPVSRITFSSAPTLNDGIIGGWALAFNQGGGGSPIGFATYSNGTVSALDATAYRTPTVANVNNANAWAATDNIRIRGINPTITQGTSSVPVVINSLLIDDTGGRTLNINGRALAIDSGGIIAAAVSGTGAHNITRTGTGYLTGGVGNNYELDIYADTSKRLNITAPIRDNGANAVRVVKSGLGKLILSGTDTTTNGTAPLFSGGLTINEGTVDVPSFAPLGKVLAPGAVMQDFLVMNGGMLQVQNDNQVDKTVSFESQYGITLGKAGGRFATDEKMTFIINSRITGTGGLTMGDTGALDGSNGGVLDIRGQNDFQGGITVNYGSVILGGSVTPFGGGSPIPASNTFKGPITINGGQFILRTSAALPTSKPDIVSGAGGTLVLLESGDFGSLNGDGSVDTGVDTANGGTSVERLLKITQDINTTYAGSLRDGGGSPDQVTIGPVLSLEKRGKGVLILAGSDGTYHGATRIYEGVLQVASLGFRGPPDRSDDLSYASSIGLGNYDKNGTNGLKLLDASQGSADNLLIASGAALSFVGTFDQTTDRAFTIGVGGLGASILANSATAGAPISWVNRPLTDSNGVYPGNLFDDIKFSGAGAATLNLGGRNVGLNRFGKDLHDNGAAPLSLTKTGDGQWLMGSIDRLADWTLETTRSRNDFTGSTTIYLGTLGVEQNGVFGKDGDQGGGAVNLIGGVLDLRNVNYSSNKTLNLQGGRLRTPFGTNAWAGPLSLDISSVIETTGTSGLKLSGNISGRAGVTKQGFGTLTLEGNNTFLGGVSVQEGTLRLDYSTNVGSKLADGGNVTLGGGRQGATLDIVGGTSTTSPIVEIIGSLNLSLGQNRITRSDPASTTIVRLNALENARVAQGATLDISASNITQTDRLNDSGGLLGTWMTVGKSDWAKNNGNGIDPIPAAGAADGFITALSSYTSNTWGGGATNTTVTSSNTVSNGLTNTLRFASPTAMNVTLSGVNTILSDGILQAPSTAGKSNIISGGSIAVMDNGFGGNLIIHQNDNVGSLTIDSAITNGPVVTPVTGTLGASASASGTAATINKLLSTPSDVADLIPGQLVTGSQIEPNTAITAIDYVTGEITLNQGRTGSLGVAITIQGVPGYTGDVLVRPTPTSIRQIRLTGSPTGNFSAVATGNLITGTGIPGGSTIASITTDPVNPASLLVTISNDIPAPAVTPSFTLSPIASVAGQMYFNGQINRFRVTPATALINLSVGMLVTGDKIEDFTAISSIDFNAGDIFLTAGRNVDTNVTFTVNGSTTNPNDGTTLTGETMVANSQNRIRLKTGASFDVDNGLVTYPIVGQPISGGSIPASTTVTAVAVDPNNPTWALVTLSQNLTIPAIIGNYVLNFNSRNGVAKFGDGTLILGGASTYNGPTYITGGKINVKTLTNGGVAGPLGAASNASGNLVISGGTLGYIGDTGASDRGFTINEVGTIEIARQGAVATLTGNISGGTGLGQGVLQVSGQGTTKISHIGGNVSNAGTLVTPAQGGSTTLGGITVQSGTLQLAYNNPNSNNSSNRFAASTAALTMAGGKLELIGLNDVGVPFGSNPSENRTQQFLGKFTIGAGSSEVRVTGGALSSTTITLQDPNNPSEPIRQAGGSVHFARNPQGLGTVEIFLAMPSVLQGKALTWATFQDVQDTTVRGINDFAYSEDTTNAVLNADEKNLYTLQTDVTSWDGLKVTSEKGLIGFGDSASAVTDGRDPASYGITNTDAHVYALRYYAPVDSTVTIKDKLTLNGGAILLGSNIVGNQKTITGGQLTAGSISDGAVDIPWNNGDGTADLLIHNYNASKAFKIESSIVDNNGLTDTRGSNVDLKVNLVQSGWGTTYLTGTNTYTGATFVNDGVLRLGSTEAIPGGIGSTGGTSNIRMDGGVIGLEAGNFYRPLGTGIADVQFTGSGGFTAYRSATDTATSVVRDVNFGGSGAGIVWGANGFVPGGQILKLSSTDADATIRIVNPIDLVGGYRQVSVADSAAAIDAELSGALSGNGGTLAKLGQGSLFLSAGNAHTGGTILGQGSLIMKGNVTSPVSIGSIDATQSTDQLTLQMDGAAMLGGVSVANKNGSSITTIKVTGNSTAAGGVDVNRNVFVDAQVGRVFTISGAATGTGRFTINDGGVFGLSGASTFGSGGSAQGTDVDGAVVVRNGTVQVGSNSGLGTAVVELGDNASVLSPVLADRSTAGRSLLQVNGIYDDFGNGIPGDVSGFGAFLFKNQSTLTIDGKVYTKSDSFAGTRILVNGETDHPERNGVYEFNYFDGSTSATTDDTISLRRVAELRDARQVTYGSRVTVASGTDAGKTYFLTSLRLPWTTISSGTTQNLRGIAIGCIPTTMVAAGENGTLLTSTDSGATWIARSAIPAVSQHLNAVAGTASDMVVVGNNGITLHSSNGTNWSSASSGISNNLLGVAVKNGRFCGVGAGGALVTSPDGINWTADSSGTTDNLRSIAASPLRFVAVGDNGRVVTSEEDSNGIFTWTPTVLTQSGFTNHFRSVTWTGSVFIIVGSMGESYVSGNGLTWTPRNPSPTSSLAGVAGTRKVAISVGGGGLAYMTTNEGSLWTAAPTRVAKDLSALVVTAQGRYFAVGEAGTVLSIVVPDDQYDHALIGTPLIWKEEKNLNPNVSLLASAAGISVANNADINSLNGTGSTTLGGAAGLTGTGATFTGNFTLQNMVPGSGASSKESRAVRLTSESTIGHGIEFGGVFSEADSNDSLSLVKVGTGIVTLSGSSTYRGGTQVNAGTLLVNSAFGSGTGSGTVKVTNFGSILGGTGSIDGATTLSSGGALSPGDVGGGIGQLNFGSTLTLGVGSSMIFELGSALNFDRVSVSGKLTVDPTSTISVLLSFLPTLASGESLIWDILDWGSAGVSGNLADILDLPALSSPTYYWDTSRFNSDGEIAYRERNLAGTPPVHFAVKDGVISENGGAVKVAVELDWSPTSIVTVPLVFGSGTGLATLGNSPTSGDYITSATSLTFNPGERSKELILTIRDDAATESTEKIVVSLNAANKTTPSTFTLSIRDNDGAYAAGDNWTLRNPMVTNETLNSLAKIGSTLVTVGSGGAILTSADGTTWAKVPLAITPVINAMATDGTTLVAVGQGGRVLTTSDGTSWTIRSCGGGKDLLGINWTGSYFVAVGSGGVTYTSTDGTAWAFQASGSTNDLGGVASATGLLVAVGQAGTVVTSADNGATWAAQSSNASGAWLRAVAYNGTSTYVAVGDGGMIITSSDGSTWGPVSGTGITTSLKSVHWDGGAFIASGAGGKIYTSANGSAWTSSTSGITDDLHDTSKLGSLYVAVGAGGTILTSTDAATWTKRSSGDTRQLLAVTTAGTAVGAQLIAVGNNGSVLTSTDTLLNTVAPPALTWTAATLPGGISSTKFNGVAAISTMRIMVGNAGAAATSADGTTWISMPTGSANNLNAITVKGTTFCAVGDSGAIFTSVNGSSWVDHTDITATDNLRAVTTDGSKFLAMGTNGIVLTSSDGATWTPQDAGTSVTFNAVTWTGSLFIAVGNGGVIFTSLDGAIWDQQVSGLAATLTGVAFTGNNVVAVGLNGAATVSIDGGLTWTKSITGTSQNLRSAIVSASGKFVAVGDSGTVITTERTLPPAPAVFFANASDTVSEAVGTWSIPVMLNPPASKKITVPFTVRTAGSTATKTSDYLITGSSVVFNPGETVKNIVVTVKNDAVDESDEQFIIDLGTPTGITGITKVAPTAYTLVITDEYLAPAITAAPNQSRWVVIDGSTITPLDLTTVPTGSQALSVQWLKATTKLGTPVRVPNSGDTMHYIVPNVTTANAGAYFAKVINPLQPTGGTAISVAEIAVVERKATTQLMLGKSGGSVSLTANAAGNGIAYQWFKGSQALSDSSDFTGTHSKTLTIKTLDAAEQDIYKCQILSTILPTTEFATSYKVVIASPPNITPPASPATYPTGRVGTPYNYPISRAAITDATTPLSFVITGLPGGLSYNKTTGLISGIPTVSGTFTIKVSATNPQATTGPIAATLTIDKILDNAIGTFYALAERSGSHTTNDGTLGLGARVEVTTSTNGTFTGKLTTIGTATSFTKGQLNTTVPTMPTGTIVIPRTGKSSLTLSFTIDTTTQLITGTLTDATPTSAALSGWRNTWSSSGKATDKLSKITDRLGTHNFMASIPTSLEGAAAHPDIPQGDSFASAKVDAGGAVSFVVKLADNTAFTNSAPMGPSGQILMHQGIYTATNPGSLSGTGSIANDTGHTVTGTLTWSRSAQPTTGKTVTLVYRDGFSPISLTMDGGLYVVPTATTGTGIIMDGKATGNNFSASFFSPSTLALDATTLPDTSPNLSSFRINSVATATGLPTAAAMTMTFTTSTGTFTGSFTLKDSSGASRKMTYYGMVIPDPATPSMTDGIGAGYFLAPNLVVNNPTRSGRVTITPLP